MLVGELARALLRLERGLVELAAATESALRGLEDLLPASAAGDDGFGAGHLLILLPVRTLGRDGTGRSRDRRGSKERQLPSILRTRAWSACATTRFEPFLRFELRLSAIMPCRRFDERRIALPVPESLKRFRAARFAFILGIGCSFRSAGGRRAVGGALVGADLLRGLGGRLCLG